MKKIIIFLTVLCLLVSCFTLSTFAAGNEVSPGVWTLNHETAVKPSFSQYVVDKSFSFTFAGKQFLGFSYNSVGLSFNLADSSADPVIYTWSDGKIYYEEGGVRFTAIKINVPSGQTLPNDVYEWFTANFTYEGTVQCDGTSCPANDVDHNNICDTCGNILTFNLRSTLLTYAHTVLQDWIDNGGVPNLDYWLIVDNGNGYYIYSSASKFYQIDGVLYAGEDTNSRRAIHRTTVSERDDGVFVSSGWSTRPIGVDEIEKIDVADSSHSVSFFFQTPLWKEIRKLAEVHLKTAALPDLGGAMKILVVCGIGLLALVTGLVLLSKKFRIFLR